MKILEIKSLAIPDIKVIRFARFHDHRGYFSEHFRNSDLLGGVGCEFLEGIEFLQANESFSKGGTLRGLHFQWNPYMGKLVRTLLGRMIDLVLDIRKGSPTFGKIIAYDMPVDRERDYDEWIWVPPGFAHGNMFPENSMIEYFCSGEYSPGCEAGVSPLSEDIDWSMCDEDLHGVFSSITSGELLITEKDRDGYSVKSWTEDEKSELFIYGKL